MNLPTRIDNPGAEEYSSALALGECLREQMYQDPDFYFFSPDETTSNKLSAVYEASDRAWGGKIEPWDKSLARDGRVIEMLSENTLFAVLAGHILSGGSGCMTSYESFFPIISSQLDQYLKFLKQSKDCKWRGASKPMNLLSTSCWQRQDHNGFTHQNPALISSLLAKPPNLVNCFFPADDVSAVAAWEYMMNTKNVVNLTTFNKNPQPRWIDINHARFQLEQGCSIYQFASDNNPDVVVAAVGDVAALNAARYNLDVQFYQSDLSSAFSSCSFDLIVCNPPYIPSADCSDLQPEVLKEPLIALDGGKDGMHFYRRIVSESSGILKQGGMLLMELGINEASQVRFALERNGFTDIEIRHDLNGIERMILGTRSVAEGI